MPLLKRTVLLRNAQRIWELCNFPNLHNFFYFRSEYCGLLNFSMHLMVLHFFARMRSVVRLVLLPPWRKFLILSRIFNFQVIIKRMMKIKTARIYVVLDWVGKSVRWWQRKPQDFMVSGPFKSSLKFLSLMQKKITLMALDSTPGWWRGLPQHSNF